MPRLASVEHIFDRVQLVRGKGERRRGRLCVMSFVALLAGERHTDAPATASPFIRHFAIALNDAMPDNERQRLKLFAPRIIGTNDGLDAERVRLVQRAIAEEIIPRLQTDRAADWLPSRAACDWGDHAVAGMRSPQEAMLAICAGAHRAVAGRATNKIAITVAKALVTCAAAAPSHADDGWYWSKAIDVLDRLCDVGLPTRSRLSCAQVARAGFVLDHPRRLDRLALRTRQMLQRLSRRQDDASPVAGTEPAAAPLGGPGGWTAASEREKVGS